MTQPKKWYIEEEERTGKLFVWLQHAEDNGKRVYKRIANRGRKGGIEVSAISQVTDLGGQLVRFTFQSSNHSPRTLDVANFVKNKNGLCQRLSADNSKAGFLDILKRELNNRDEIIVHQELADFDQNAVDDENDEENNELITIHSEEANEACHSSTTCNTEGSRIFDYCEDGSVSVLTSPQR
ncbi:PREDICTED: uncharacterized protein LOC106812290 [Priapulus caudatus]|uniref:Uncharacterized protein LOC106812290 n=1 Tax=Priapulus caudatus TaxID=37621 RepID=A0ABM1EHE2_PRICU|nr:PREDICTED: uncharacterized protein LOC106812290 [Priapulus caudatus]